MVSGVPPSPNETRGLHWAALRRLREGFKEEAGWAAQAVFGGGCERLMERARLTCTVVKMGKPFDTDNCYALLKPIIDGLKNVVIVDDSPDRLELVVLQWYGKPKRVDLLLEELL
jgi:hypothetical protein